MIEDIIADIALVFVLATLFGFWWILFVYWPYGFLRTAFEIRGPKWLQYFAGWGRVYEQEQQAKMRSDIDSDCE